MTKDKPAKVLPNRKVIVERSHEDFNKARDLLCQMAFLEEVHEHIMIYRITKRGIWYGCWRGIESKTMINRLKEISKTPITERIREFIQGVTQKYGRLVVSDYNSKLLRCKALNDELYLKLKERIERNKKMRKFFFPFGRNSFLIPKQLIRIESITLRKLDMPIKSIATTADYNGARSYSPHYRKKYSERGKISKVTVCQEIQRVKAKGENLSLTNLRENYYQFLTKYVYPAFKIPEEQSKVGVSVGRALQLAGFNLSEEITRQKKKEIKEEINEIKSKGEELTHKNLTENHFGLLQRISKYYSDYCGEKSRREKAIEEAGFNPAKESQRGRDLEGCRLRVEKDLKELKDNGVPLLFWYVHDKNPGLCTRISEYFKNLPGEESSFVKALRFSDLYQTPKEKNEIAEKSAEGKISQTRLGHLQDDELLQRLVIRKEFQLLAKREEDLRRKNLGKNYGSLNRRIRKFFKDCLGKGTSRYKALKFAGLNPEKILKKKQFWHIVGQKTKKEWIKDQIIELEKDGEIEIPSGTLLYSRIMSVFKDDRDDKSAKFKALQYADFEPKKVLSGNELWETLNVKQQQNWIQVEVRSWVKDNEDPSNLANERPRLYNRFNRMFNDKPGKGTYTERAMRFAGVDSETHEIVDDKTKDKP